MNRGVVDHQGTKAPSLEEDKVATQVVDAAFKVHKTLRPGLLESVYEACLVHELHKRGLNFERQCSLPIQYENLKLEAGLRLDLVVDGRLVVELKSVESLLPVHKAQL